MKKLAGLRRRLTYANVIATLALFLSLSGASMAAAKYLLAADTIPASSDLAGSTYGNPQIADGNVTTNKIAAGAITSSKFDGSAVAPNADKLDGLDSSAFATAGSSYTKSESDAAYLGINAKAGDSDKLDGLDSSAFATAGSSYTKGESDAAYLGINAKAGDSDKLDGLDSTGFIQGNGRTLSRMVRIPPGDPQAFPQSFDLGPFRVALGCYVDPLSRLRPTLVVVSFETTLAAAWHVNMFGDIGGLGIPSDVQQSAAFNLGINDGWLVQATLTGGDPTLTILGSSYTQNDTCLIQFHAAVK